MLDKFILLLLLANSSPTIADQKGQLLDRVVVEINSVAYTQRQIELFSAVFDAISFEMNESVTLSNSKNWQSIVDKFESFILVEQEAHRLGSYLPSNNMIEKGFEVFEKKKASDSNLKEICSRLNAGKASIRKSIVSVLRVAAFLRSKQNRQSPDGESDAFLEFKSSSWFKTLSSRAIVRFMNDGKTYKRIRSL